MPDFRQDVAEGLVRIARDGLKPTPRHLYGFLLDQSDEILLLQVLSDRIDLDGYEIVRRADVTALDTSFPQRDFFTAALRMKGIVPERPRGVAAGMLPETMRAIPAAYPLVVIHRERRARDEVAIGSVERWLPSGIRLRWITPTAEWAEDRTLYRYASITRVGFGGEYERTLALVATRDA